MNERPLRKRLYLVQRSIFNGNRKIPRPANAFMIFANENRKKIAKMFPQESNKEISCRLGKEWKNLVPDQKNNYYLKAKAVDADHKRKYPGNTTNLILLSESVGTEYSLPK